MTPKKKTTDAKKKLLDAAIAKVTAQEKEEADQKIIKGLADTEKSNAEKAFTAASKAVKVTDPLDATAKSGKVAADKALGLAKTAFTEAEKKAGTATADAKT